MPKQSWEHWKDIEFDVEPAGETAAATTENSFDARWMQAQKIVAGSGQIATPEAIEAVFPNIDA